MYTHAQARYVSCGKCGSYYALKLGELNFIRQVSPEGFKYTVLPGSKCTIEGSDYMAISSSLRMEAAGRTKWREYTLFNPIKGYLYLSECEGHWMLLHQLDECLSYKPGDHDINYQTFKYHIFSKYKANVKFTAGEFPYDIAGGEKPEVIEFISPPYILTGEYTSTELRWYHGKYIDSKEVGKMFGLSDLPERNGIGQIQPTPFSLDYDTVLRISVISIFVFFLVQLYFNYASQDAGVCNYSNTVSDVTNNQPVTTPSFQIKGGTKNMVYHLSADVDNHYLETNVLLVSDNTGESFNFSNVVEYYHGYSDGESWSEGDKVVERIIEEVPEGTYHLVINPEKEPYAPDVSFSVNLQRDVPRWSNLFKAVILMLILPVVQYYRSRVFEKNRWSDSNYTPYKENNKK